jgi:hypothetical protein
MIPHMKATKVLIFYGMGAIVFFTVFSIVTKTW